MFTVPLGPPALIAPRRVLYYQTSDSSVLLVGCSIRAISGLLGANLRLVHGPVGPPYTHNYPYILVRRLLISAGYKHGLSFFNTFQVSGRESVYAYSTPAFYMSSKATKKNVTPPLKNFLAHIKYRKYAYRFTIFFS